MIKIATWNINSINAHIDQLIDWLKQNAPDIVLLQELKCEEHNFPRERISELGYSALIEGQKAYNGVCILSKLPLGNKIIDFNTNGEARFIRSYIESLNLDVICVYVPNGGDDINSKKFQDKLVFLETLTKYVSDIKQDLLLIGGDFNVAPFDIDVADGLNFTLDEKVLLRRLLNSGLEDTYRLVNKDITEFTWWDYRNRAFENNMGMRIDFLLANYKLADKLINIYIDKKQRSYHKCSDHVPVVCEFNLE